MASKEIRSDTDVKANSEAVKHANVKNTRTIVNLEANMRAGGKRMSRGTVGKIKKGGMIISEGSIQRPCGACCKKGLRR